MPKIAKSAVRNRPWDVLGLSPHDGVSFREVGEERDKIVLCLCGSAARKGIKIKAFEGF